MSKKNRESDKIRSAVSKDYAKAVKTSTGCCCGSGASTGHGAVIPKGVVAKLAGYGAAELEGLPEDAIVNSFGCGNPLAFSGVKEGQTVLDLGSGAGIDLLIASKKVGPGGRVIGVEMTDEMIERSRKNIAAAGAENIEVRKGIIEELPVESNSVDWVISNCVINLSPEKERVFSEIARVLRSGGVMLVSDIVASELPAAIREEPKLYSSCISGAVSEEAYLEGIRKAGLVEATVKDRLVYDKTQLRGFLESELQEGTGKRTRVGNESAAAWAQKLEGLIWSVKVFARKP